MNPTPTPNMTTIDAGAGRVRTAVRAGLTGALTAAVLLAAAAPAHALMAISAGHIDAFDVDYVGTSLTLDVRNHTVTPVNDDTDPATLELRALPASKTTVPSNPAYSFLGPAGADVWILPQSQNTNLLWPGWDAGDVPSGVFTGNQVTVRLVSASGPGLFALYTVNAFGTPSVRFNTGDGLPDSMAIARGSHGHANWGFRAAGIYTLGFQATATTTGGVVRTSPVKSYRFVVG